MSTKRDISGKQAEYAKIMGDKGPRSAITVIADPFAEFSLTDFADETAMLETLAKQLGRKFVQARGTGKRGGASWVSHNGTAPVAVVHPERFVGRSDASAFVNFWHDYLLMGLDYAHRLAVPFYIITGFDDAIYTMELKELPKPTV